MVIRNLVGKKLFNLDCLVMGVKINTLLPVKQVGCKTLDEGVVLGRMDVNYQTAIQQMRLKKDVALERSFDRVWKVVLLSVKCLWYT